MTKPSPTLLIDNPITHHGQNINLDRTWDIGGRLPCRVRTQISMDTSYAFQSRMKASGWTANGWSEVASIGGADPQSVQFAKEQHGSFLDKPETDEKHAGLVAAVYAIEARLLADAAAVLL